MVFKSYYSVSIALLLMYLLANVLLMGGANDLNKTETTVLLNTASAKFYEGDYGGSISTYLSVIDSPSVREAWKNLATLYEQMGQYDQVVLQYRNLLQFEYTPENLLGLGVAYYNLGEIKKAEESLKETLANKSLKEYIQREANYYLGLVECLKNNTLAAANYFKAAIEIDEYFAPSYLQLGELNFSIGEFQKATEYYNRALEENSSLVTIYKNLGLSYLELGDAKNSIKYLQRSFKENSEDSLVESKLAMLKESYPSYFETDSVSQKKPSITEEFEFKNIWPLENQGKEIRIGIMTEQQEVYFRIGSDFQAIIDEKILFEGKKGSLVKVWKNDGKFYAKLDGDTTEFSTNLTVIPNNYVPVLIHNVEYGIGYSWGGFEDRQYRGNLELIPGSDGLTVVNIIKLEEYLLSVIPSEMPALWPINALKAQAVAARTYAIANMGKHSKNGFDLCSWDHCTAYKGINSEHPRSTIGVRETSGEIMTYNGRPIDAVYTTNSGGHTEDSIEVWGYETPYLKGVSTELKERSIPNSPVKLKEWLLETPDSYSNYPEYTSPGYYRWQKFVPIQIIENRYGIDNIKAILPAKTTAAGSVEEIVIVTETGSSKTSASRYKLGGLLSNRFWILPEYTEDRLDGYIFYGSGWGHGVGMDQVAVAAMASENKLYKEILEHFYSGVKIEEINN